MNTLRKLLRPKRVTVETKSEILECIQEVNSNLVTTDMQNILRNQALEALAEENYEYIKYIGGGAFGEVIAVRGTASGNKTKFAAKIVPSRYRSTGEKELWPKLDHENVLPLVDIISSVSVNIFIMPLHRTTLHDILKTNKFKRDRKSFKLTKKWLGDILQGLKYIHGKNLCHLDLKSDNILITEGNSAVICDFTSISETHSSKKQ